MVQEPLLLAFSSYAGVAQLVERQPSKLNVAGSNPVSRSLIKTIEVPLLVRSVSLVTSSARLAQW